MVHFTGLLENARHPVAGLLCRWTFVGGPLSGDPCKNWLPARTLFLQGSSHRGPATGVQQEGPATGWRAFSSKPVKWTIGRFYWLTRRTRPFLQLWRRGSDFLYTKNSAMGRSDCLYPKNSARPSWGAMRQKMAIFKVRNSVCRVQIFPGAFISYSPRGLRIVSGGAWGDNRGAMRQKMAIFKERISVCRDAKISRSFNEK